MSLKIGRHAFWLCTKQGDIIFRSIESAGDYVAKAMVEMSLKDEWNQDFFIGLARVERRNDKFAVTDVSEEMWRYATIITWKEQQEAKKELDTVKMEVVKQYSKYRDGK